MVQFLLNGTIESDKFNLITYYYNTSNRGVNVVFRDFFERF